MVITKAVCVVHPKGMSRYALNEKNLRSVLDVDDVRDRKVVVVSMVGGSRVGKSVLANFFLRYLESKYGSQNVSTNDEMGWMEGEHMPLLGFPWSVSVGTKPVTKGIWMSSKAYLTDQKNHKIAIVVLDSQGLYDSFTTNKDWTTILAFTSLVSSVTCYNVMNDIGQLELDSLLFFCQYGKFALQSSDERSKPMQNMMFVIRDWQNSRKYGEAEGAKRLAYSIGEREDFKKDLTTYFDKVSCFLMPFPGMRIEKLDYHGSIDQLNADFKTHLQDLVQLLFDPENLVLKVLNKDMVTAEQLIECFKTYIVMLQRDELPEPKSLFLISVEVQNRAAKTAAKNLYTTIMKEKMEGTDPEPLTAEEFQQEHIKVMKLALEEFDQKPKIGTKATSEMYRAELEDELQKLYRQLRIQHSRKHMNLWRPWILSGMTLAMAIALEAVLARWKWHRVVTLLFNLTCKWALLGLLVWSYMLYRNLWD